jgi:hypothetical protein
MKSEYKYFCIWIVLLLIFGGIVFAQNGVINSAPVKNLGAAQSGNSIKISWQSESEYGVRHYQIYRSSDKAGPFTCVRDNISCLGSYQVYTIDDNTDLFKTHGRFFFYKVRAILIDGSFKESVAVSTYYSSTSSTAKRTWGSIKAMFR